MSELVANCPRCGANKITFDLQSAIQTREFYGWQFWYEAFCICRQCRRSTIFVLSENVDGNYKYVHDTGLAKINSAVNCYVTIEGTITLKDAATVETPLHLPERIDAVFREGATCLAVDCNNAAGTMFRLCIDLVTRTLLPEEETEGPNHTVRRTLGLRLPWLFDNGHFCQKVCVSCRRASRKTVTTGHTLETSRRKMPKIFSTSPPFCSNVCAPNLSVFGLLRSGDVKEGILMHNKGVKLSILRHRRHRARRRRKDFPGMG